MVSTRSAGRTISATAFRPRTLVNEIDDAFLSPDRLVSTNQYSGLIGHSASIASQRAWVAMVTMF